MDDPRAQDGSPAPAAPTVPRRRVGPAEIGWSVASASLAAASLLVDLAVPAGDAAALGLQVLAIVTAFFCDVPRLFGALAGGVVLLALAGALASGFDAGAATAATALVPVPVLAATGILLAYALARRHGGRWVRAVGARSAQDAERRWLLLKTALDTSPMSVVVFDDDGSAIAGPFIGMILDDGRPFEREDTWPGRLDFRDAESGEPVAPHDLPSRQALRGVQMRDRRYRLTDALGRRRLFEVYAAPLSSGSGGRGALVISRDVTRLGQAQERLAHFQELLLEFGNEAPALFRLYDVATGRMVSNETAEAIPATGDGDWERAAMRIMKAHAAGDPSGQPPFEPERPGVVAPGRPLESVLGPMLWHVLAGNRVRHYRILHQETAQGPPTAYDNTAIPLFDETGAVSQIVQFAVNVDMQFCLEQLDAVLTSSGVAVLTFDSTGAVRFMSGAAREWWGTVPSLSDMAGFTLLREFDLSAAGEDHPFRELARGRPVRDACFWHSVDETTRLLLRFDADTIRAVAGGERLTVVLVRDVTVERRAREVVERAAKITSLSRLAGGLSHEFNNVMGAIAPAAELLQAADGSERTKRLLSVIVRAATRGRALSERLRAFAGPKRDRVELVGVVETVEAAIDLCRADLDPRIEIASTFDLPGDTTVFVDRGQLEHTLLALCHNARDAIVAAGSNGRIDVDAAIRRGVGGAPDMCVIRIADDGCGMSATVRRSALEPFFTTKVDASGAGLGLTSALAFAVASGGDLVLYSEEGVGTTVSLLLPVAARPVASARADRSAPAVVRGRGQRVILVDDEPDLREASLEMLRFLAYAPAGAASAEEALRALDGDDPVDALVTDVRMPGGMDGYALARQARAIRPDIALVYMSGYPGWARKDELEPGGVFIDKPFSIEELSTALAEAFRGAGTS